MKKITLLGACLLCGLAASAQLTVLKEAEGAMKSKASMDKVVGIVTPAFTNPETAELAQTWYIPGKAAFNEFDALFGLKAFGKLPEGGQKTMGHNLIDGYGYFKKAIALDSVADAKGKIKTKYSKDIINVLISHYQDYNNNAIELFNEEKDFKGAYDAWGIYLEMSKDPLKYKGIQVPNDTLLSEITYNQAIAAWQYQDYKAALASLMNAKKLGYNKKNLYDLAIFAADNIGDTVMMVNLCNEAMPLYGAEDNRYINAIINNYLSKQDYTNAFSAIQTAIEADPNNSNLYYILGVIYENKEQRDEAREAYKKSVELDPESEMANYLYGKSLCDAAYILSDAAPSDFNEYEVYYNGKIKPLFEQAIPYLEKSVEINSENDGALNYLQNVYYNLKDEKNLDRIERMQGKR